MKQQASKAERGRAGGAIDAHDIIIVMGEAAAGWGRRQRARWLASGYTAVT
jgi:hypothetical protein